MFVCINIYVCMDVLVVYFINLIPMVIGIEFIYFKPHAYTFGMGLNWVLWWWWVLNIVVNERGYCYIFFTVFFFFPLPSSVFFCVCIILYLYKNIGYFSPFLGCVLQKTKNSNLFLMESLYKYVCIYIYLCTYICIYVLLGIVFTKADKASFVSVNCT